MCFIVSPAAGFRYGFSVGLSGTLCALLGSFVGRWLRPVFVGFEDILSYLRLMGIYLFTFALGYFTLALLFGTWFWSVWKINPDKSFNNLPLNPSFGDFVYFSVETITTLGYGDITPASGLTKALTCTEAILGIGWITVVLATVLTHVQPRFNQFAQLRNKRPDGQ
jgi:voltage-gated potassium channel Kch